MANRCRVGPPTGAATHTPSTPPWRRSSLLRASAPTMRAPKVRPPALLSLLVRLGRTAGGLAWQVGPPPRAGRCGTRNTARPWAHRTARPPSRCEPARRSSIALGERQTQCRTFRQRVAAGDDVRPDVWRWPSPCVAHRAGQRQRCGLHLLGRRQQHGCSRLLRAPRGLMPRGLVPVSCQLTGTTEGGEGGCVSCLMRWRERQRDPTEHTSTMDTHEDGGSEGSAPRRGQGRPAA